MSRSWKLRMAIGMIPSLASGAIVPPALCVNIYIYIYMSTTGDALNYNLLVFL